MALALRAGFAVLRCSCSAVVTFAKTKVTRAPARKLLILILPFSFCFRSPTVTCQKRKARGQIKSVSRAGRASHLSLLVQRSLAQRNTPRLRARRCAPGPRSRWDFPRGHPAPTENAAHPCAAPLRGLVRRLRRFGGAPEVRSKIKGNSNSKKNLVGAAIAASFSEGARRNRKLAAIAAPTTAAGRGRASDARFHPLNPCRRARFPR